MLRVQFYLSGPTCTHANIMEKGEYRAACAKHRVIVIAPDTSPRGDSVPDAKDEYDFGKGAGFYVNATQQPWSKHYQMRSYIEDELPALIAEHFLAADMTCQAISGHSMAATARSPFLCGYPERFASVSAFSPIVAPSLVAACTDLICANARKTGRVSGGVLGATLEHWF